MSNSTTQPGIGSMTILAGATFRELWQRATIDYETQEINGVMCKMDGTPVPASDILAEDYTNCTAVMEIRDADTNALLYTLTTTDGSIAFVESAPGKLDTLMLIMQSTATGALPEFTAAVGHVEVRRPWGDIERQYEFTFAYSQQKTAVEPPALP